MHCANITAKKTRLADPLYTYFYPSATSSAIIRLKPTAKATTPIFECSPADISGISSSTTTYIIAPAAKDSR